MNKWQAELLNELERVEYQMMEIRGEIAEAARDHEEESQAFTDCEDMYRLADHIITMLGDAERIAQEFGTPVRV